MTEREKKHLEMEKRWNCPIDGCAVCKHQNSHGQECWYKDNEFRFGFCKFERKEIK